MQTTACAALLVVGCAAQVAGLASIIVGLRGDVRQLQAMLAAETERQQLTGLDFGHAMVGGSLGAQIARSAQQSSTLEQFMRSRLTDDRRLRWLSLYAIIAGLVLSAAGGVWALYL